MRFKINCKRCSAPVHHCACPPCAQRAQRTRAEDRAGARVPRFPPATRRASPVASAPGLTTAAAPSRPATPPGSSTALLFRDCRARGGGRGGVVGRAARRRGVSPAALRAPAAPPSARPRWPGLPASPRPSLRGCRLRGQNDRHRGGGVGQRASSAVVVVAPVSTPCSSRLLHTNAVTGRHRCAAASRAQRQRVADVLQRPADGRGVRPCGRRNGSESVSCGR